MTQFFSPVYIAGQTASGKTGVSIELAKRLGSSEIINADAYQIYQGIETLSAAPTIEERSGITHHLFGVLSLTEECDAARFAELARSEINRVAASAVPIVVGGSGLYLKSITHGLAPTPPADEALRKKLDEKNLDELVAEYQVLDPQGAAKTNLKNRRYVARNLEICLLSGRPASEIKSSWENDAPGITGVYLQRSREEIYQRINRRTSEMFEDGVVEQIKSLTAQPSATAVKAIGFREIRAMLAGELTEEECIAIIQQITRRYAKRQETWFKREHQYRQILCSPDDSAEQIVDRILAIFPLEQLRSRTESPPCPKSKKETQQKSS